MAFEPHILFKLATRSRPERCLAVINSIVNNIEDKDGYTIVVSADLDDAITYNQEVINTFKAYLKNYNVRLFFDNGKGKVDAINRDIDKVKQWDLLVVVGDHLEFFKGFDTELHTIYKNDITKLSACYHFFDGFQKEKITMPVMDRAWYDSKGFIFHPSYKSNFEEVDLKEMATAEGKYVDMLNYPRQLFIRKHPENLFYAPDIQMLENQIDWRKDIVNFEKRKRECFK